MKVFRFCKEFIFKYRWMFSFYILLNIVTGVFGIITPLLTGKIVDNLIYIKSKDILIQYCILFVIINIVDLLAGFLSSYIYIKLQTKSGYALNKYVINHLQNVSMSYFTNTDTAYLNQRINNDSNSIIIFCIGIIIGVVVNTIVLIFTSILLIKINNKIFIIMFVLIILYMLIYFIFKKTLYQKSFEAKEAQSNFFSKLNEQLFNIKFINIHSIKDIFAHRLDKSFGRLIETIISSQKLSYLYTGCDFVLGLIAQLSIFLIGGFEIIDGEMTVGSYIIMANYFSKLMSSSRYFFNLGRSYQDNLVSYNRIVQILAIPQQKHGNYQIDNLESIKVENLTFNYNEKNIFKNFNAEFKKGNIYCLMGHNGVGKSTLINLILGLYLSDYEGQISYNNIDISKIDIYSVRRKNIGVTEQEPILIPDTLINNITFEKDYDSKQINEYIRILGLNKYILSLENGLNTVINEKSSNISGGEKQKISILRQFIKNPEVMIFDEPTSALDLESREKFKDYLSKIKYNKIIIVISHDNFIQNVCDDVIYLSENSNN